MQSFDDWLRVAATLHARPVEAVAFGVIALRNGKGQGIFDDDRVTADEGFASDPAKLVNTGISSDTGFVINGDVTGQGRGIGHNDLVSELAIVSHMGLRHQQIIITDLS